MEEVKTQDIEIGQLKASEYNPREITEKEFDKLVESIKQFGFIQPIVVNIFPTREYIVISGHQRLKAANALGMKKVPCVLVELPLERERILNVAMNRIGGKFNEESLVNLISQIESETEDLTHLTGLENAEVQYLLNLADKDKEQIFAKGDEDYAEEGNRHNIQPGDIVTLDNKHRIICGESDNADIVRALMGDKKIDLIVTSPPYNVGIDYESEKKIPLGEYNAMIENTFRNIKDYMNKARYVCVNLGKDIAPINLPGEYHATLKKLGYAFFRNVFWKKPNMKASSTYRNPFPRYYTPTQNTESLHIYTHEETPDMLSQMITYKIGADEQRSKTERIPDILLSKYAGNIWEFNPETSDNPAQLPFLCIRFFTYEGERIIDPFCGSGTSIIAADQLNRVGYGIEKDPEYVSLSIDRYLAYKKNAQYTIQRKGEGG